jgi:ArsR family transcriptional regulator
MSLANPSINELAAFNKAVGDSLRLEVLRVLAEDAYGVLELSEIFDCRQSGMSHHLKLLAEAGLVAKRREGNSIFYSRAMTASVDQWRELQQELFAVLDPLVISGEVQERVVKVKADRAAQSQAFFEENAEKFKEQQDLIAEYPTYGGVVTELLGKAEPPAFSLALEIGPGEGEFLKVLSEKFSQVIALDNAPLMLKQAQQFCDQQKLENVGFINNDTAYLKNTHSIAVNKTDSLQLSENVDCVVMNMVLHHTPSPAEIFHDIACVLKAGGVLIITELCRHDQDWVKTSCGDQWLGFDANELQHWAVIAGLKQVKSHYFALRNGFQVQLQQFMKTS